MVSVRSVVVGGLFALAFAFVGNTVVNFIPASEYALRANSVRGLAKMADKSSEVFCEAQPFIDLSDGVKFDAYYEKLDRMKQAAVKLHGEANELDRKSHCYLERVLVFGYFTN